jgi:hypothetical protein
MSGAETEHRPFRYTDETRKEQRMSDKIYRIGIACGLPEWVVNAISSTAWDQGHSAGQEEVDRIAEEMIDTFYKYHANQDDPRYKRVVQ